MSLNGQMQVLVKYDNGTEKKIVVSAREFGLEEGGDWERDRDENFWHANFIYVAFLDEFAVQLEFTYLAGQIDNFRVFVRDLDVNVISATIVDSSIDFSGIQPPSDNY